MNHEELIKQMEEEALLAVGGIESASKETIAWKIAVALRELQAERDALEQQAEVLKVENERLKGAMLNAMVALDRHDPLPATAYSTLLLALNPELESAKAALAGKEAG